HGLSNGGYQMGGQTPRFGREVRPLAPTLAMIGSLEARGLTPIPPRLDSDWPTQVNQFSCRRPTVERAQAEPAVRFLSCQSSTAANAATSAPSTRCQMESSRPCPKTKTEAISHSPAAALTASSAK